MYSGIGARGFTNEENSPICSPPQTFTAPISVIAAPFLGEAPVVSKSTITKVVWASVVCIVKDTTEQGQCFIYLT